MYHAMNDNRLYNFVDEQEILVEMFQGKEKCDIMNFLDDISIWIDDNREYISDEYLPLAVCSIGLVPTAIGAYLFGLFVGKAMEKHGIKIKNKIKDISKEDIMIKLEEESIFPFNDEIFGGYGFNEEGDNDDKKEEKPRK